MVSADQERWLLPPGNNTQAQATLMVPDDLWKPVGSQPPQVPRAQSHRSWLCLDAWKPDKGSPSLIVQRGGSWASLVAQMVKNLPAMRETWVQTLGWEDPLEKGMATQSSILAWRSPWTEDLVGYSPWSCKELDMTEHLSTNLS